MLVPFTFQYIPPLWHLRFSFLFLVLCLSDRVSALYLIIGFINSWLATYALFFRIGRSRWAHNLGVFLLPTRKNTIYQFYHLGTLRPLPASSVGTSYFIAECVFFWDHLPNTRQSQQDFHCVVLCANLTQYNYYKQMFSRSKKLTWTMSVQNRD